jgi:hypothetical protein
MSRATEAIPAAGHKAFAIHPSLLIGLSARPLKPHTQTIARRWNFNFGGIELGLIVGGA